MPTFVRILTASDLDGTPEARANRLQDMLDPEGWSLFATSDEVPPVRILGAFFGMRRGKQAGPFAYRSITLRELEGLGLPGPRHAPNTEGTLPPLVANAHHDLFLTEMAQAERLDHFLSTRPVQELSLLAVLEEQVRIHNDELVIGATRKNIRDRILKMGKQLPEVLPLVDRLRSC